MSILDKIIGHKRKHVRDKKQEVSLDVLKTKLADADKTRPFKEAIAKPGGINLIAEIKKASPSRGVIRDDFVPVDIARTYEENGAAAISILTEDKFFQGDINFLPEIRRVTHIPLLRKDFIIDEYQIYESRVCGADALLLIAAVLSREEMNTFLSLSRGLNLDCLVEVHTEEELQKVLDAPVEIIGINNRNLQTFEVDFSTTLRLKKLIPPDKIVVAESGIRSSEDVRLLAAGEIEAVLVGESLLRSEDIGEKTRELMEGVGA